MFLLLPCKSTQGWLICDDSHSPEALNWRYQASLKAAQAVCLTDSFSFSGVSFLYLLHYPLCLSLACLPGSSLVVGLGVAAKTKMNILLAASQLPAFSPVRQRNTCGKVTADEAAGGGNWAVSTPPAFAALSTLYPIISRDNNTHLLLSRSPP